MPSRGGVAGEFISPTKINVTYGDKSAGIARGSGADWFGPQDPMAPIAPPEVASRQWDFPAGFNLNLQPRVMEPVSFPLLRGFADSYDILRLIIETRKDQVARLNWSVKPRDETSANANDPLVAQVTNFLRRPDGVHPFSDWLRMLLEDLFVIDAPTLYMQRTYGGKLLALQPLDGATIKPVVDDWGRTPQPYEESGETIYPVAYQQVLKGFPAIDYSVDDVLYRPLNIRTHHAYGFSPVEQILTTVNIALRRQIFTLEYFTSGNIPDSLIGVPESWTPEQNANYQKYWDAYIEGDLAARRRAKFVPGGVAKTFIQTKEPELKGEFDEWLARICCFAFSISPQALTRQMNRASAETQKEIAEEEGLWPVLNWAKQLLDDVIEREFSAPQLEFAWGQDQQIDPSQQAVILSTYVKSGVLTINEARARLGMVPLSEPAANTALTLTANGYVGIGAGADAADTFARAPVVPQAHPSTGALARAAQDEDLERAAHLSRTNPRGLSDRRNPSSLTVSLSNREGRSSLDKYSPDQPRVPAGHSDGGQWTSGGAGGPTSLLDDGVYRPGSGGAPKLTLIGGAEEDEGKPTFTEPRVINGRVYEVTPGQSNRYDASLASANWWTAQVRSQDPNWAPGASMQSDDVEGAIARNKFITLEAKFRYDELQNQRMEFAPPPLQPPGVNDPFRGFDPSNLENKLKNYALNPDKEKSKGKYMFFRVELGFDSTNWQRLADQIYFDENIAVPWGFREQGQLFREIIPITGANGEVKPVTFGFIREWNGLVRLTTAFAGKRTSKFFKTES